MCAQSSTLSSFSFCSLICSVSFHDSSALRTLFSFNERSNARQNILTGGGVRLAGRSSMIGAIKTHTHTHTKAREPGPDRSGNPTRHLCQTTWKCGHHTLPDHHESTEGCVPKLQPLVGLLLLPTSRPTVNEPSANTYQYYCKLPTYLLTPWSRVLLEKLTSKLCS